MATELLEAMQWIGNGLTSWVLHLPNTLQISDGEYKIRFGKHAEAGNYEGKDPIDEPAGEKNTDAN